MRKGWVYYNDILAGELLEVSPTEYVFTYDAAYLANDRCPAISLTLPKSQAQYRSSHLFPFFSNMLSEGHNRAVQARLHHLDPKDDFGILLATAGTDTPGAITIKTDKL